MKQEEGKQIDETSNLTDSDNSEEQKGSDFREDAHKDKPDPPNIFFSRTIQHLLNVTHTLG